MNDVVSTARPGEDSAVFVGRLAAQHGARSIAFPAISTGIYGYPLREATAIAVATVRAEAANPGSLNHVIFACYNQQVLDVYEEALAGNM